MNEENKLVLKDDGLGSLDEISQLLWDEMKKEIKRNGYGNLTLNMEGAARGIQDIIRLNNIEVKKK